MDIVSKTQYYPHHTHTELLTYINSIQLQPQIQSHFSKTAKNTSIQQHKNPNTILSTQIHCNTLQKKSHKSQQTHLNCHLFLLISKIKSFFNQQSKLPFVPKA